MRSLILGVIAALSCVSSVAADSLDLALHLSSIAPHEPAHMSWPSCVETTTPVVSEPLLTFSPSLLQVDSAQPVHAAAIEHSDAYQTRAKIHKYASFATLPLFTAEVALGQSLDGSNDGKKSAHAVVGAGLVGLFAVNTVTGAWNLFGEGWQDKQGRTLRFVHGLLMMATDVGFLATTASAPSTGRNRALTFEANRTTHRNLAIASVSVGTAGYLLMLFGNH